MANPGRRLSPIAEAAEEEEEDEEEAAVALLATAGGASVGLVSPGTAAAAAALMIMRRSIGAPPVKEWQAGRGGLRGPNWAALGDLTPPNPQVSAESGLKSPICARTTLVFNFDIGMRASVAILQTV